MHSHAQACTTAAAAAAAQVASRETPMFQSRDVKVKRAVYGGRHTAALLPGDGIGPEMLAHVREALRAIGTPVDFETVDVEAGGAGADPLHATALAVRRNGIAIKGNIETPLGAVSLNVSLRVQLDLFAYVQHCAALKGVASRYPEIDVVIIRENTEGEYAQLEHESVPGVVESLKIVTRERSLRIARFAFEYADRLGRKKVTAVHKANIMKLSDGLFLESCRQVAKDFPHIEHDAMIVDNCSMQLVSKPGQFDVMVMPNLYGNVIGNIAAGLVGGAGVVSGANYGRDYAVFESGTRNSGRNIAGKNVANPSAMMLAAADMLAHMGLVEDSLRLRKAVLSTMEEGLHTPDLGGQASTLDVVQSIINKVKTNN